jgi:hypothetical protein
MNCYGDEMPIVNTIERAFQLAREATSVDEIRFRLRKEGYSNVDVHLSGRQIRAQLTDLLNRRDA